jgi:TonB-linked SusC/RagA family outer membrane protein
MFKNLTTVFLLLFGLFQSLNAQQTVKGTILDEKGNPIIAVNVILKGTGTGTVSDLDGKYNIQVPNANSVLEFSFIGYKSKSESVGNRSTIDVTLEEDAELLDEVVVSALGFTQKKDQMGSTYSTVATQDVVRSGETGLINGLAGKAAGVRVARSNGDPGAGSTIQIRGANTITGSSSPLVIVDGVPISNSTIYGNGNGGTDAGVSQQSRLNDINPADIESIQVLKGASAASLWGSRAANGVIVITTKKGKSGKPTISFTSSFSYDEINRRHPLQDKFGQGLNGIWSSTATQSWGDQISARAGGADEVITNRDRFEALDGTVYYPVSKKNSQETFNESNFDAVFQNGRFLQNDLSISGGTDKSTFFFSLGNLSQDGIIRGSDYDRTTLRLNNQTFFTDWLSMTTRAAYTKTSSNRVQQSSNIDGLYLGLLRNSPDFDIRDYKGTYYNTAGQAFPNAHRAYRRHLGYPQPAHGNPIWVTSDQKNTSEVNRFLMNAELNVDPLSWLKFTFRGGLDASTDNRVYFFPKLSAGAVNGELFQDDIEENEFNFDAIAKGSFNLADGVSMLATLGWNYNNQNRDLNYTSIVGFLVDYREPITALNTSNDASSVERIKRYVRSNRGYSVLNFNVKNQFFLNATATMEAASSVAGSFFYPSFDGAWQFTQLEAFKGNKVLSFGKLRASWGKVGVQPQPHRAQTLAEGGVVYSSYSDPLNSSQFGGGFRINNNQGNPNLRPEIKTETEVGFDLRFLNNKLGLTTTYYQNKIVDLLFNVSTAASTGFTSIYTNGGQMENRGIEFDVDYDLIKKKDFSLNIFGNWNNNRNKVIDILGVQSIDLTGQSISSRAVKGQPLGVLWGTRAVRDENGAFILDKNGFPQQASTQGVIGNPNPDWRGAMGVRANWKSLSINLLFEHSQGGDFAERTRFILRNFGTHADVGNLVTLTQDLKNVTGKVFPSGTTVRGNIFDYGAGPVLQDQAWYTGLGGGLGDGVINELAIADFTWTRLREVSLSYSLNSPAFRQKTKLSSVVFSLTGRNLWLKTDIVGIDPDTNQFGVSNGFGIEYFTNPGTRSVLFTLQITY